MQEAGRVASKYLIVRDAESAQAAAVVFAERRQYLTREQALNGSRNLLDGADILIWSTPNVQDVQRDRDVALELVKDAQRTRIMDMTVPTAEMFTPEECVKHGINHAALEQWAITCKAIIEIPKPPADEAEPINRDSPDPTLPGTSDERSDDAAAVDPPSMPLAPDESRPFTAAPDDSGRPMPDLLPIEAYSDEQPQPYVETRIEYEEKPHELEDWPEPLDLFKGGYSREANPDHFPAVIRAAGGDAAARIGCGKGECYLGFLTAYSGAADHRFGVQRRSEDPTDLENPRIWGAVVGVAGGKKSPAIKIPHLPLSAIDESLVIDCMKAEEKNNREMLQYENAKRAWAAEKDASKREASIPKAPERVPKPRIIVEDLTLQAAGGIAKDNPRGIHLKTDELSSWVGSFDQFSKGSADRGHWLASYDGGRRVIDRVGTGHTVVPNWSVSLAGTITPAAIRTFSGKLNEDGLLQRMMIVISTKAIIGENRAPDAEAWAAHCDIMNNLYALNYYGERGIKLSKGAQDVYDAFVVKLYELKASSIFSGSIQSHLAKWEGLAPRLMLLYQMIHACQYPNRYPDPEIPREFAEMVCSLLMEWLLGHILEFWFNVLDRAPHSDHVQWIAGYILAHNSTEVTQRELQRHYPKWDGVSESMKAAVFNTLTDAGWVRSQTFKLSKAGLPRRHDVNPAVHQFAAKAQSEKASRARTVKIMNSLGRDQPIRPTGSDLDYPEPH